MKKIRVTVWNENWDEQRFENVHKIYPKGIHAVIAEFLGENQEFVVRTSTLDEEECGLSQKLLDETDVLIWWGHVVHHMITEKIAFRVCRRVLEGMGMIFLHSALYSKPFQYLVGGIMNCAYREWGEKERVWNVNPAHEITWGLKECFEIQHSEVYREPTGLPLPDELLFISWYAGGEAGISGGCYYRGKGRIFVFTPGHEDYPIFYNESVQTIIKNATKWAFNPWNTTYDSGEVDPYEPLKEELLIRINKDRD